MKEVGEEMGSKDKSREAERTCLGADHQRMMLREEDMAAARLYKTCVACLS